MFQRMSENSRLICRFRKKSAVLNLRSGQKSFPTKVYSHLCSQYTDTGRGNFSPMMSRYIWLRTSPLNFRKGNTERSVRSDADIIVSGCPAVGLDVDS